MSTKIEWADETWNPITGCSPVSAGCNNCYARRMANRLRGRHGYPADNPFNVTLHPDRLEQPFRWLKPRKVFVCSMGDLFHEDVPFGFIAKVFGIMHSAKQHIFMVLTKRPERMKEFFEWFTGSERCGTWPKEYPHVMIGVTAENQETADQRIPILLSIPATVRFVSVEPMLGAVEIEEYFPEYDYRATYEYYREFLKMQGIKSDGKPILINPGLDWIICGGESGYRARSMSPDWARNLRDQCEAAGVPFCFKQWGEWVAEHRQGETVDLSILKNNQQVAKANGGGHWLLTRVGKKAAGRLLDGREWSEYPIRKKNEP